VNLSGEKYRCYFAGAVYGFAGFEPLESPVVFLPVCEEGEDTVPLSFLDGSYAVWELFNPVETPFIDYPG